MSQCIIFCRTNVDCNNLEIFLKSFDKGKGNARHSRYSCSVVAGKRSMMEQQKNMKAFENGEIR